MSEDGSDDRARSAVVATVALFDRRAAVLQAEQALAESWAAGRIELLDGVLVDWPNDAKGSAFRFLRNVPRFAALAATFWSTYTAFGSGGPPSGAHPYADLPPCQVAPDSSAIIGFAHARWATPLRRELIKAGGSVTTVLLAAARYDEWQRLDHRQPDPLTEKAH